MFFENMIQLNITDNVHLKNILHPSGSLCLIKTGFIVLSLFKTVVVLHLYSVLAFSSIDYNQKEMEYYQNKLLF